MDDKRRFGMGILNGIAIADPAKKDMRFVTNEGFRRATVSHRPDDDTRASTVVEGITLSTEVPAHYESAMKDAQLPHTSDGDQALDMRHVEDYESVKGHRDRDEVTIPYYPQFREDIEDDKVYEEHQDLHGDVEEPILETGKKVRDQNGAGYYDPGLKEKKSETQFDPGVHSLDPVQKYGRPVPDSPTLLANPKEYAEEKHFLYVDGDKSFQDRYYKDNPWKNDDGRIHLFEAPRTPTRLA